MWVQNTIVYAPFASNKVMLCAVHILSTCVASTEDLTRRKTQTQRRDEPTTMTHSSVHDLSHRRRDVTSPRLVVDRVSPELWPELFWYIIFPCHTPIDLTFSLSYLALIFSAMMECKIPTHRCFSSYTYTSLFTKMLASKEKKYIHTKNIQ